MGQRVQAAHDVRRLHTLYLGGGTPSLLGPDRLERLLKRFRPLLTPGAEVTVESNPEDVDAAYAAWASAAGVRVSLGAQSFSAALRAALGRHAAADPGDAYAALRAAGVANVGLDLIHGIPGQSMGLLDDDIAAVLALRPDHVSWYELDLAEGTALAARLGAAAKAPDDDAAARGYRRLVRRLSCAGYDWYEVSNFALPGRRARHNMAYWRARPYLGLGPGAVSTTGSRRRRELPGVRAWIEAGEAGVPAPAETEEIGGDTAARERLLLAARCGLRVPLAALGDALDREAARSLARAGFVSLLGGTIRVTRKGRYVADEVCVRLFRDTRLRG